MVELNPPGFLQNRADHSARLMRNAIGCLVGKSGVVGVADWTVTQRAAGANMSVDISTGEGYVQGTEASQQGYYFLQSDSTPVNKNVGASSATLARKDIVIARVRDTLYSGVLDSWAFEVIPGTAGSGVEPNTPANSYKIATIDIAANATSIINANITRRAVPFSTFDGTVVCTSTTRPSAPLISQQIFETDTGLLQVWTGTAWKPILLDNGAWTAYTPVWGQIGGSVLAIGNGTLTGKYQQRGSTVHVNVLLTRGSTSNVGTAAYTFSLPVTAAGFAANGAGMVFNGTEIACIARMVNGTTVVLLRTTDNARISNTVPGAWATADTIQFSLTYEKA